MCVCRMNRCDSLTLNISVGVCVVDDNRGSSVNCQVLNGVQPHVNVATDCGVGSRCVWFQASLGS